ncbi:MAG: 1-aminocyclopropane-1-carboxylate deaminase/D-cysteine desulfhydrase [Bacteroidia bacterium]|nr:1-aminocyclopropane-1-carboxylate deaminase/D-cysteine desulfhydrase [Bacteroidia bacterium]
MAVRVLVKREDLNHPFISGNKWWKLKYNLEEAKALNCDTLLTFGGAYSNHIYATAAAAKEGGFKCIGIIRGEKVQPLNSTLAFAESCGMKLHYVSREAYRQKIESSFIQNLQDQFGNFFLIPEGGTNELAVKGVAEFALLLIEETEFDYLCLPVGTGGTMAGIVVQLAGKKKIIGYSALKGGSFLNNEIKKFGGDAFSNWRIEEAYHFGGYAKTDKVLGDFMKDAEGKHHLLLDQVYTGKMLFGVFDQINKGLFNKGSTILVLHTGGLRGRIKLEDN